MSNESIIQVFEGTNVRIVWNEEEQEYYFSIADIVQVLTETVNPRDYIKKMLKRDPELKSKWGTICPPVRMLAPDGKKRMTQAATLEGVFRVIQSVPSKKAEPLKQWLAEVGKQRIDQMELALNTLAEAATTEISRHRNPRTMAENKQVAQSGGNTAKLARKDIERKIGHSVISSEKASDHRLPAEDIEVKEIEE